MSAGDIAFICNSLLGGLRRDLHEKSSSISEFEGSYFGHLCPSAVKESLYRCFWNVLYFCVRALLFVSTFFTLTPFLSCLMLLSVL